MSDRELLELAAKAASIKICHTWLSDEGKAWSSIWVKDGVSGTDTTTLWNPLGNDGCALRLAIMLRLDMTFYNGFQEIHCEPSNGGGLDASVEDYGKDVYSAVRRAIVRAAAEIGRSMS